MTVPVGAHGALALYSAVGDAFAGRRLGFGRRRAAIAARFARRQGGDDAAVAAAWVAGALAEIGLVGVTVGPDAPPRARMLALADVPLHGARLAARLDGVPAAVPDVIRWYREHDDGTGVPDGLRWDGIPVAAASLGIVHAFLEAMEDASEPRDALEALFALAADSGRRFNIEVLRAFRAFVTEDTSFGEPFDPSLPALDEDAALAALAASIDARDSGTDGRSERLAARARTVATRIGVDDARAARLARLLALGRASEAVEHDAFDPLSRFAREPRSALAQRAATIAESVPGYASDAPALAASAIWYEERAVEPHAAILALVVAADALDPDDAPRRLAAAAGTQFDPDATRAYLAGFGAS